MFNLLIKKNKDRDLDFFNDSVFDDFFNRPFFYSKRQIMRTDLREEENHYLLDIELPGLNKEDIKLSLEDGYLTVGVEKEDDKDQKDDQGRFIRRERFYGSCSRRFYVGSVNEADIQAEYKDGILTINVPKVQEADKKKFISVK